MLMKIAGFFSRFHTTVKKKKKQQLGKPGYYKQVYTSLVREGN